VSTAGILTLPTNLQYKYGEHENTHEYRHSRNATSKSAQLYPRRTKLRQTVSRSRSVVGVLKAYWKFRHAYSRTMEFGPGDGARKVFQAVAGNVTKQK
jgi:hypothetical protein